MTTILISVPTILLSSTAPSVLSRRSVSVCAALPSGKMLPVDLGRFFRPYGAEHMHAHPPPEPSQTQPAMPSFLVAAVSSVEKKTTRRRCWVWAFLFSPPCLMPKAPSRSGAWLFPRTGSEKISQQLPPHPSRAESHLQPLLKADREAPPSSAPRSRVRRIQREPTAKQVVTLRLKINRFCAYRTNDMIFLASTRCTLFKLITYLCISVRGVCEVDWGGSSPPPFHWSKWVACGLWHQVWHPWFKWRFSLQKNRWKQSYVFLVPSVPPY